MNRSLKAVFALLSLTLLATSSIQADTSEKMIIALKTDDFELAQTDISTLGDHKLSINQTELQRGQLVASRLHACRYAAGRKNRA